MIILFYTRCITLIYKKFNVNDIVFSRLCGYYSIVFVNDRLCLNFNKFNQLSLPSIFLFSGSQNKHACFITRNPNSNVLQHQLYRNPNSNASTTGIKCITTSTLNWPCISGCTNMFRIH